MTQQDTLTIIQQIKKTLESFMISLGILCGMTLIIYFFTYGALVDAVGSSLIWFEVVSSVFIVLVLIFLRRVCFFLTRLKLGRRPGYGAVFRQLSAGDLLQEEETLLARLGGEGRAG